MSAVLEPLQPTGVARAESGGGSHRNATDLPFATDDPYGTVRIDILLLPNFDFCDLGLVEEAASIVNRLSARSQFEVRVRSDSMARVRASCGIELTAAVVGARAPNVLVLGGATPELQQGAPWLFPLRRAAYDSMRVYSDAGGTLALACAGMLDRQVAAAPWYAMAAWQHLAPRVRFLAADWAGERKFRSSTGGRALVDLLLAGIARQFGAGVAASVALSLGRTLWRVPGKASICGRLPSYGEGVLQEAVLAIRSNLDKPLDISQLCVRAKASERTLQRLFRRHLGTTIFGYHRTCRLRHARELLRLTQMTVTEVALAAGFQCAAHFSQAYARNFGCTPRRQRQMSRWPSGDRFAVEPR